MEKNNKYVKENEYMIWLDEFTKRYPSFNDSESSIEDLTIENYANVLLLKDLYKQLSKYASKNYMYLLKAEKPCSCYLRYEDTYYYIGQQGYVNPIGAYHFVKRCKKEDRIEGIPIIDYDLFREDKLTAKAEMINIKLEKLVEHIDSLTDGFIPKEVLEDTLKRKIKSLQN